MGAGRTMTARARRVEARQRRVEALRLIARLSAEVAGINGRTVAALRDRGLVRDGCRGLVLTSAGRSVLKAVGT